METAKKPLPKRQPAASPRRTPRGATQTSTGDSAERTQLGTRVTTAEEGQSLLPPVCGGIDFGLRISCREASDPELSKSPGLEGAEAADVPSAEAS